MSLATKVSIAFPSTDFLAEAAKISIPKRQGTKCEKDHRDHLLQILDFWWVPLLWSWNTILAKELILTTMQL